MLTALAVIVVGSISVIGLAIVAAVLPLLFTERGAQMTFVIHSSLLLISGVYAPVDVLPRWLQALSPLSPMTYILRSVRVGLLEGGGLATVAGDLLILAVMGAVLVPSWTPDFPRSRTVRQADRSLETKWINDSMT